MAKRKSGVVQNSLRAKKIKSSSPSLKLDQLPTEILQKIIGNLSLWHHKNIRATNLRLYGVCDELLWHQCKVALEQYRRDPVANKEYGVLKVLHQVTRVYLDNGFRNLFLGLLLSVLRQNYHHDPFCLTSRPMRQLLQKFFNTVDQSVGNPYGQRSKAMYLTTVVGILAEAGNCSRLAINLDQKQLHLHFKMESAYFGMLWQADYCQMRRPEFSYPIDKNDLLVIFAEILVLVENQTVAR
jgi:hypothetical protein